MQQSEFNDLPVTLRGFVSYAPNVMASGFDYGVLEYHSSEYWESPLLKNRYEDEKQMILNQNGELNEQILFHGCPIKQSVENIATNGFDLSYIGFNTHNLGIYGKGIYFSKGPNGAVGYSTNEHQCDALESYTIIVSKVLVGKTFNIPSDKNLGGFPYEGSNLMEGYDSHSYRGEVVIFNTNRILPLGLVHCKIVPATEHYNF